VQFYRCCSNLDSSTSSIIAKTGSDTVRPLLFEYRVWYCSIVFVRNSRCCTVLHMFRFCSNSGTDIILSFLFRWKELHSYINFGKLKSSTAFVRIQELPKFYHRICSNSLTVRPLLLEFGEWHSSTAFVQQQPVKLCLLNAVFISHY
jgi:hypothetical protein